jgi:hypothetical protein
MLEHWSVGVGRGGVSGKYSFDRIDRRAVVTGLRGASPYLARMFATVRAKFRLSGSSINFPQRKRVSYFETGIGVINQVEPAIVIRTKKRLFVPESKRIK